MLRRLRLGRRGSDLSLLGRALPVVIEKLNHRNLGECLTGLNIRSNSACRSVPAMPWSLELAFTRLTFG